MDKKAKGETTTQIDGKPDDKKVDHLEILTQINNNSKAQKLIKELENEINGFKFLDLFKDNNVSNSSEENEITKITKERDEYLSLLQRFKADFENYKKRAQKIEEANINSASERILSKIFTPIQDISRAIDFANSRQHETMPLEGITIIYNTLNRVLIDEGLTIIEPKQGDSFDPRYHEAICMDESGKFEPGKIVQNFEKGYKINEKVIQAAKVMVAAEKPKKENKKEENEK